MKYLLDNQNDKNIRSIAYFSMEIGLEESIPTYAGGLGILAGDTVKSFADLIVPVVAVTIVSKKGYFRQGIKDGKQIELPLEWNPEKTMRLVPEKAEIFLEGRKVVVRAWEHFVAGIKGFKVPVYFLDTNFSENSEEDRIITDSLYNSDHKFRLKQEAVLGIGGVRILKEMRYSGLRKYHMNEGHAALLTLELLRESKKPNNDDPFKEYDVKEVRKKCVFTTHTPVPAGHDQFDKADVDKILGDKFIDPEFMKDFYIDNKLNMTLLALSNSEYINGVAQRHTEISRSMFPGYSIDSITNGVNSLNWTCNDFRQLYDKHIPSWKFDPFNLRYALGISRKEIWEAHVQAKKKLIDYINSVTKIGMDYNTFTIGFARRSTPYKRLDLFFRDPQKLLDIHENTGKIQVIVGGKAHPNDTGGKELIARIHEIIKSLEGKIRIVYLVNYDIDIAKLLVSGADIWMNTPRKPLEASGTSGMKACHNGIPNFSVLDGWWLEGYVENVTGWAIGDKWSKQSEEDPKLDEKEAESIYVKLKQIIVPMFYNDWDKWTEIMRHSIAFNASFFNTHRMVHQYVLNSYFH